MSELLRDKVIYFLEKFAWFGKGTVNQIYYEWEKKPEYKLIGVYLFSYYFKSKDIKLEVRSFPTSVLQDTSGYYICIMLPANSEDKTRICFDVRFNSLSIVTLVFYQAVKFIKRLDC
jgi:hypothetical protein